MVRCERAEWSVAEDGRVDPDPEQPVFEGAFGGDVCFQLWVAGCYVVFPHPRVDNLGVKAATNLGTGNVAGHAGGTTCDSAANDPPAEASAIPNATHCHRSTFRSRFSVSVSRLSMA